MSSDYGDEDDFMNNLLADMDESLLRTPAKSKLPAKSIRPSARPIERPKFPGAAANRVPNPTVKRELAITASAPKSSVVFTPAKPDVKEPILTTQLSSGKRALAGDDIEESAAPEVSSEFSFTVAISFMLCSRSNCPSVLLLKPQLHQGLRPPTRPRQ